MNVFTRRRRRRRALRVGQPALIVLLTLCVTGLVTVPALESNLLGSTGLGSFDPQNSGPEETSSLSGPAVTRGSSTALPGQSSPRRVAMQGPGTPAGDSRVVRLEVGGRERGYLLLPALGTGRRTPSGLLVVLHQDVGSARAVAEGLGLDVLRRQGVTLAYPAGVAGSWNAGSCCGVAKDEGIDDVAFVSEVLEDVGRRVPIDPRRRGVLGYSGGGMLAYRLLCGPHPPLAAAVEVSGSLEATCTEPVALPDLLSLHGALDGTVGLTKPIRVRHLGIAPRTVMSTLASITAVAGCGGRTIRDARGDRHLNWRQCRGGSTVDVQIVGSAGHGWDDIGAAGRAVPFLAQRLGGASG